MSARTRLAIICVGVIGLALSGCASSEERAATGTVRALSGLNDELSASGGLVRLSDFAVLADEPYASTAAVNRLVFRERGLRQSGRTEVDVMEVSAVGGLAVVVACLRLDDVTVTSADPTEAPDDAPPGASDAAPELTSDPQTTAVPLRYSLTRRAEAWVITEAVPVEIEGCDVSASGGDDG